MTLDMLASDGTRMGGGTTSIMMPAGAPEQIASFTTSSADGRHRSFDFTVPNENGDAIEYYLVRRVGPAPTQTYLYNISCPSAGGVASVPPHSRVSISYPSLTCTPGDTMSLTVGLDLPLTDPAYIVPTTSYDWSVLAVNIRNLGCETSDTCGEYGSTTGAGYGGWSPVQSLSQGMATPDQARILTASAVSDSAISLSWDAPAFDNGAPITTYHANCSDASDYLDAATTTWRQPAVWQAVTAPSNPLDQVSVTLGGLTAGTTYLCAIGAENSVGGFEPVFDAYFPLTPTHANVPAPIDASTASCTYTYNALSLIHI